MDTRIVVRVENDENGHFIAKAVGYPGVITFGRSQEEAVGRVQVAWDAMARFNAIKTNKETNAPDSWKSSSEMNFQLQFA